MTTASASDRGSGRPLQPLILAMGAIGVGAFFFLLAWAPAEFMGVDDAYYFGIGANLLEGRGLQSAFGSFPTVHSPLWPMVAELPHALIGVDASAWAHVLVVLSGACIVAMTGWFAWRGVRIAAPIAMAAMLVFPVFLDLAGGLGLDLPAAALAMLYVALGLSAVRRGSVALGLTAGLVFAAAFLVKELVLPFAPVPLLAGLLRTVSVGSLLRVNGAIVLAALAGTAWWFVTFTAHVGTVYRLGTPGWTLGPLLLAVCVLAFCALGADRLARALGRSLGRAGGRWSRRLAWTSAIGWACLLSVYFALAPNPYDAEFLVPRQVLAVVQTWAPSLWTVVTFGLIGSAMAIVTRLRRPAVPTASSRAGIGGMPLQPNDDAAIDDLLLAVVCGLPFVLLILSIGEGPRHYVVELAFLVALGAIGWSRLVGRAIERRHSILAAGTVLLALFVLLGPIAAVAGHPSRRTAVVLVALAAVWFAIAVTAAVIGRRRPATTRARDVAVGGCTATLTAGSIAFAMIVVPLTPGSIDATRAAAVTRSVDWIRANVPKGTAVAFGATLAYETALPLSGEYRLAQVRDEGGVIRPNEAAPLGLDRPGTTGTPDWIALWGSGSQVGSLVGYDARDVGQRFEQLGPSVWIQSVVTTPRSPSPVLQALDGATGLDALVRWTWPYGKGYLETVIYRVDPQRLAFPDRTVITADALDRVLEAMEQDPRAYRRAAGELLQRLTVVPQDDVADALLTRLRKVAGR